MDRPFFSEGVSLLYHGTVSKENRLALCHDHREHRQGLEPGDHEPDDAVGLGVGDRAIARELHHADDLLRQAEAHRDLGDRDIGQVLLEIDEAQAIPVPLGLVEQRQLDGRRRIGLEG